MTTTKNFYSLKPKSESEKGLLCFIRVSLFNSRVHRLLIYHRHNIDSMEQEEMYQNEIKFSDLRELNQDLETPSWRLNCTTKMAHPSGRIPSLSVTAGWQPIFAPSEKKNFSSTINGIIRRVRLTRGEA